MAAIRGWHYYMAMMGGQPCRPVVWLKWRAMAEIGNLARAAKMCWRRRPRNRAAARNVPMRPMKIMGAAQQPILARHLKEPSSLYIGRRAARWRAQLQRIIAHLRKCGVFAAINNPRASSRAAGQCSLAPWRQKPRLPCAAKSAPGREAL